MEIDCLDARIEIYDGMNMPEYKRQRLLAWLDETKRYVTDAFANDPGKLGRKYTGQIIIPQLDDELTDDDSVVMASLW